MERMDQILNDMDLALEGVPFSEKNQNIAIGLAILEHKNPDFHYSKEDLSLTEKVIEIRNYYLKNGYSNNSEILNELDSNKIGILK